MTAIDSGTRLWDTISQRPLDELILRDDTREQLRRTLFLQPLPFVRRIIFIATPHRGSYEAGSWIAHQVAGFASLPKGFVDVIKDLVTGNPGVVALSVAGLPRSIHDMTPGNSFVQVLATTPVAPGIPTHSIVAVRGDKPLAEDDDGIVKYESAHLDGVESELANRPDTRCTVTRLPSPRCGGFCTSMAKRHVARRTSAAGRTIASWAAAIEEKLRDTRAG